MFLEHRQNGADPTIVSNVLQHERPLVLWLTAVEQRTSDGTTADTAWHRLFHAVMVLSRSPNAHHASQIVGIGDRFAGKFLARKSV